MQAGPFLAEDDRVRWILGRIFQRHRTDGTVKIGNLPSQFRDVLRCGVKYATHRILVENRALVNFRNGRIAQAAGPVYCQAAALFFIFRIPPETKLEVESDQEKRGRHNQKDDLNRWRLPDAFEHGLFLRNDGVLENTDTFDYDLDFRTWLERPDTGRSAGGNQVTRFQRHERTHVSDYIVHPE
jgi:hypothetical protein